MVSGTVYGYGPTPQGDRRLEWRDFRARARRRHADAVMRHAVIAHFQERAAINDDRCRGGGQGQADGEDQELHGGVLS